MSWLAASSRGRPMEASPPSYAAGRVLGKLVNGSLPANISSLFDQDWGTVNPETGIMRANCEDSVAWGNYGAFDPGLVARFHGDIGQKFTVECPDSCRKARASIWGCNPFMDESSICKAALGMNRITNDGGLVSFQIVPPEDHWDSCKLQQGINTDKWKWYEWKKADRPNKIARKCSKDWVASSPGVPCPEVVKKYRQNCKVTHGIEHCFGARAFKFLEPAQSPAMSPDSGTFFGKLTVTVTATADQTVACTIDGTVPNAADPAPGTAVDSTLELSHDGSYVVKVEFLSFILLCQNLEIQSMCIHLVLS